VDAKQRSEERKRIIEQRRLELLRNLGKGGINVDAPIMPKEYAVLLFDGLPGEKNSPKQQVKGLSAVEAGQKALAWLEIADQYISFPYVVIMGPPPGMPATASVTTGGRGPFPASPPPPGG